MILEINKKRFNERKQAYLKYKIQVKIITERNAHLVHGIEKRKWREWDLDHIIPIKYGFKNGIDPNVIGSVNNLRIIPHIDNIKKGQKLIVSPKILGIDDKVQAKRKDYRFRQYLG